MGRVWKWALVGLSVYRFIGAGRIFEPVTPAQCKNPQTTLARQPHCTRFFRSNRWRMGSFFSIQTKQQGYLPGYSMHFNSLQSERWRLPKSSKIQGISMKQILGNSPHQAHWSRRITPPQESNLCYPSIVQRNQEAQSTWSFANATPDSCDSIDWNLTCFGQHDFNTRCSPWKRKRILVPQVIPRTSKKQGTYKTMHFCQSFPPSPLRTQVVTYSEAMIPMDWNSRRVPSRIERYQAPIGKLWGQGLENHNVQKKCGQSDFNS